MPERRFPEGFVWGAATSAYQIEGAAREDGRGESIWDRFSHTPGRTHEGATGDVATDHYHRYREDVALLRELGLGAYRFSVAWPRVQPDGTGAVNQAGLDFYDRLVDELLANGIDPYATLYHWDLPQALEDRGGWPVRATAEAFAEYARIVGARLGDRVRHIATHNEPWVVSHLGYREGIFAPGRTEHEPALAAAHHLLVGHGLAIQALRQAAPGARLGIVLNYEPKHPATTHVLDVEAAAVAFDQYDRWFLDPVTGHGYPAAGVADWRWDGREILDGDLALIAAPLDWMGVNYYTRELIRSRHLPPLPDRDGVERTDFGWEVYPQGLTEILELIHSRTGELPLYVTENGAAYHADPADPAADPRRVSYLRQHFQAALDAIERGVPLRGYFCWSLLDNFEWASGYWPRFGIVHVDYETLARTPKQSARFVAGVAATGTLPPD